VYLSRDRLSTLRIKLEERSETEVSVPSDTCITSDERPRPRPDMKPNTPAGRQQRNRAQVSVTRERESGEERD
jgi:hypothetical protein